MGSFEQFSNIAKGFQNTFFHISSIYFYLRLYFPVNGRTFQMFKRELFCLTLLISHRQRYGQFGATFLSFNIKCNQMYPVFIFAYRDNNLRKKCAVVTLVFTVCTSCRFSS